MHEFIEHNKEELITRCRRKVELRNSPKPNADSRSDTGVPLFFEQLLRTLKAEEDPGDFTSEKISGASGGDSARSEIGRAAAAHGRELLSLGFSIDQVVHEYGDICQSITELAFEQDQPFQVEEFRTLNRCLDNAIADAVQEFTLTRDTLEKGRVGSEAAQRLGSFAHELRNHLGTAMLALGALKTGNLPIAGATGAILERSLVGLGVLIDKSLAEIRVSAGPSDHEATFPLLEFISDARHAAELDASSRGLTLLSSPVDPLLAIRGDRDLLLGALGNVLQNALKFTKPASTVELITRIEAERILIEVHDACGGLPPGDPLLLFEPFEQASSNRSGVGLGLSIAKRSMEACAGTLSVRDVPGTGCVFILNLPKHLFFE